MLQSFSISTRLTFLRIVPDSKNQQTFVDYFGYIWWRVHTSYKKLIEIVVVLYGFNQICRNFGPHVRGILPSARLYSTTEAFTCGVAQQFWGSESKYQSIAFTVQFRLSSFFSSEIASKFRWVARMPHPDKYVRARYPASIFISFRRSSCAPSHTSVVIHIDFRKLESSSTGSMFCKDTYRTVVETG